MVTLYDRSDPFPIQCAQGHTRELHNCLRVYFTIFVVRHRGSILWFLCVWQCACTHILRKKIFIGIDIGALKAPVSRISLINVGSFAHVGEIALGCARAKQNRKHSNTSDSASQRILSDKESQHEIIQKSIAHLCRCSNTYVRYAYSLLEVTS